MSVKVAINGFGRIGRLAFRQMFNAEGYEIVAINDLTSPKMLAHLLKYDSAQGRYELGDTVKCSAEDEAEGWIEVDGKKIRIYAEKDAANCPWGELGVDVVLECTGFYCSKAKSMAHINAGAKKVVISAPAGNDFNVSFEDFIKDIVVFIEQVINGELDVSIGELVYKLVSILDSSYLEIDQRNIIVKFDETSIELFKLSDNYMLIVEQLSYQDYQIDGEIYLKERDYQISVDTSSFIDISEIFEDLNIPFPETEE